MSNPLWVGVFAAVSCLLFGSGPAAIARLVVAIIIRPAVDGCASRTKAHILQEVAEVVPPHGYRYAASTIAVPKFVPGIVAAIHHPAPRRVRLGVYAARPPVLRERFGYKFRTKTSARSCPAVPNMLPVDSNFLSAIATESPRALPKVISAGKVKCSKSSKPFTRYIEAR